MHLLDTDTLSYLWARHERVVQRAAEVGDTELGTTSITKAEVLRRRCENLLKAETPEEMLKAQRRLDLSEQRLSRLMIAPFDEGAAAQLERLSNVDRLKRIGRADLLIASVTLANHATLVTRNVRHFRQVPNLRVVNWVD
jgi:tRNA(fMet)-specific endonuclease VapC